MIARDVRDGFSDGLRDFGRGLSEACTAIGKAFAICGSSISTASRSAYNHAGQYTFPLEQELFNNQPPSIANESFLFKFCTAPFSLVAIVSSVTWLPLLGNSVQSTPKAFVSLTNLALPREYQIEAVDLQTDPRHWGRKYIYGSPGVAIGLAFGIVPFAVISTLRVTKSIITNCTQSGAAFFTLFSKAAYGADDLSNEFIKNFLKYGESNRTIFQHLAGVPGILIGAALGAVAAVVIATGRIAKSLIINSAQSGAAFFALFAKAAYGSDNLGRDFANDFLNNRTLAQHLAGVPGILIGAALGAVTAVVIATGRVAKSLIINSAQSGAAFFALFAKAAYGSDNLGRDFANDFLNNRTLVQHLAGVPGILIGAALGAVAAVVIATGRVAKSLIINSAQSGAAFFALFAKTAYGSDNLGQDFANDFLNNRTLVQHLAGVPGILIGAALGAVAAVVIATGRVAKSLIINSAQSGAAFFALFAKAAYGSDNSGSDFAKDFLKSGDNNRTLFQHLAGVPGILIGATLGAVAAVIIATARVTKSLIINSAQSGAAFFALFAKAAYGSDNLGSDFAKDFLKSGDNNRTLFQHLAGVPGILIGATLGAVAAVIIATARVTKSLIINSAQSGAAAFAFFANFAYGKKALQASFLEANGKKRDLIDHLAGMPGLLIGSTLGSIAAVFIATSRAVKSLITNSTHSGSAAFAFFANLAYGKKALQAPFLEANGKTRDLIDHLAGIPGLLIGGTLGAIAAVVIATGRGGKSLIKNSTQSGSAAFAFFANLAYGKKALQAPFLEANGKTRDLIDHLAGVPGLLIGGALGAVAAVFIATGRAVKSLITNSAQSGAAFFALFAKAAYGSNNMGANFTKDFLNNRTVVQQLVGVPGILIGTALGAVAAVVIATGRVMKSMVTNSAQSGAAFFALFAKTAYGSDNLGSDFAKDFLQAGDKNRTLFQHLAGVPGILIGAALGTVAAVVIATGRVVKSIVTNSAQSGTAFFALFAKAAYGSDNLSSVFAKDFLKSGDNNRTVFQHLAGVPGILIGAALGAVAAVVIATGRVVKSLIINSAQSGAAFFALFAKAAYGSDNLGSDFAKDFLQAGDKSRTVFQHLAGVPGILIGTALGAVAAVVIATARVTKSLIINSAQSGAAFFALFAKAAYGSDNLGSDFAKDFLQAGDKNRTLFQHLAGVPGILIGTALGAVAAVVIATCRVVKSLIINSAQSGAAFFALFAKAAYGSGNLGSDFAKDFLQSGDKNRTLFQHLAGVPGIIMGAALGAVAAGVIAISRVVKSIVTNSAQSSYAAFAFFTNFALAKENALNAAFLNAPDGRKRDALDHIAGIPGILIGSSFGLASCAIIMGARAANYSINLISKTIKSFCTNTAQSFIALGGSVVNGMFDQALHSGLGGDERSGKEKAIGSLGYVAAGAFGIVALPLAQIIRKILPFALGGLLGIATSPLTAFFKGLSRICSFSPRFPDGELQIDNVAHVEQAFKNIYSSLNAWGHLQPGKPIVNGDGKEKASSFVKKSFTFNSKSITEKTLNKLLEAYRAFPKEAEGDFGLAFFDSAAFNETVDRLKQEHTTDAFMWKSVKDEIASEINKVTLYVKTYIKGHASIVEGNEVAAQLPLPPADLYPARPSWSATFWGGKRVGENGPHAIQLRDEPAADIQQPRI